MVRVKEHRHLDFEMFLASPKTMPSQLLEQLIDAGFVITSNIDEVQQVIHTTKDRHYSKNDHLELTILPTEQCNFRCVYCYENFKLPRMTKEVQDNIIKFVEKEIKHRKGLAVGFFGGEPLLAMDVIERLSSAFIRICEFNNKPYSASITTNGFDLDVPTFEHLRKLRVNHFQVTIDGPKQIHDNQRVLASGAPTFDRIFTNLCSIRDNASGRMWNIALRTNVTAPMMMYLDEYRNFITSNFGNDRRFLIQIRQMWTNDSDEADKLVINEESYNQFLKTCSSLGFSLAQDYQLSHNLNYICYAGKPHAFVIRSNGDAHKCTALIHIDEKKSDMLHLAEF